jgi:hypothetical protein
VKRYRPKKDARHIPPRFKPTGDLPEKVEIVAENDGTFSLLEMDSEGTILGDSCFFSLKEAKEVTEEEFGISADDWEEVW